MWRRKSYDAMSREGEEASQGVKKVVSSSSPCQQAVKPGPASQQAVKQGSTFQQSIKQGPVSQQVVKQGSASQQVVKQGSTSQQVVKQGSTLPQSLKQGSTFQQVPNQGSDSQQTVKLGSTYQPALKQGSTPPQALKLGSTYQQAVKQGSECQQNVKQQTAEVKPHLTEDKTPKIETKPLPPKNRWLSQNLAKVDPKQNVVADKWQNKLDECKPKPELSQLKPNIWQRRLDESQKKAKTVELVNNSPISNVESVNIQENKEIESNNGSINNFWTKMGRRNDTKIPKRVLSPVRDPVDLPQVTVPVRIRQFNDNRRKKL